MNYGKVRIEEIHTKLTFIKRGCEFPSIIEKYESLGKELESELRWISHSAKLRMAYNIYLAQVTKLEEEWSTKVKSLPLDTPNYYAARNEIIVAYQTSKDALWKDFENVRDNLWSFGPCSIHLH